MTTGKHKYVGFHRGGDGSGVIMNMHEWGDLVECVAERVIEELNESDPYFYDLETSEYLDMLNVSAKMGPHMSTN